MDTSTLAIGKRSSHLGTENASNEMVVSMMASGLMNSTMESALRSGAMAPSILVRTSMAKKTERLFQVGWWRQIRGRILHDELSGCVTYTRNDGRKFFGTCKDNMMNGESLFTWDDERQYLGSYVNDKREGHGVFTW